MEDFVTPGNISISLSRGTHRADKSSNHSAHGSVNESFASSTASPDTDPTGSAFHTGQSRPHASVNHASDARDGNDTNGSMTTRKDAAGDRAQLARTQEAVNAQSTLREEADAEFLHLWAAIERHFTQTTNHSAIVNELIRSAPPYVLGVTSAVVGEGKTTVAINLAESAARNTWFRVCLVDLGLDGDEISLRHGVVSSGTGIVNLLEDCDSGHFTALSLPTLKPEGCDGLTILPAGTAPSNAAKTARSPHLSALIASIRQQFDLIIVDMPAVATENALPIASEMDGIVVIARAGATPGNVIADALDKIGRQSVVGVVLNRVRFSGPTWLKKRLSKW